MSDFDAVLERLLSDPGFKAALAADPGRALAGYRLAPDEVELLGVQLSADTGGNSQVEQRTSKASLFGLLGSMTGAGLGHAADPGAHQGGGPGQGIGGGVGQAGGGQGVQGGQGGFGGGTAGAGGTWPAVADGPAQSGFGGGAGQIGAPVGGHGPIGQSLDGIVHNGLHSGQSGQVPADYHPNVDVDGDGHWDQYTVRARSDGGVDVVADMDHDGRADFVGHDVNRDGIIDSADYDEDHDGRLETHMTDVNGDGWMDTRTVDPKPGVGDTWIADQQRLGPAG